MEESKTKPKVSRVIVIRAKTARQHDVTVDVGEELMILQPRWWGEFLNAVSASEGCWFV